MPQDHVVVVLRVLEVMKEEETFLDAQRAPTVRMKKRRTFVRVLVLDVSKENFEFRTSKPQGRGFIFVLKLS